MTVDGNNKISPYVLFYLFSALAVTAALAYAVETLDLATGWLRLGVLSPAILAFVFLGFANDRALSGFAKQFIISPKAVLWIAVSAVTFGVLAFLSCQISAAFFGRASPQLGHAPPIDRTLFIFFLAFGEEIGWRGYALPRLMNGLGWVGASLLLGLVWWVWHMPGWMLGFGAPTDISIFAFGAWVVSASLIFTFFYLMSGRNVWTAVFLHAGANIAFQMLPIMPAMAGGPETFFILTGLSLTIGAAMALMILRTKKLETMQ